jgi:integrase
MVIAGRAQRLQALDLGLNIVGLQVEVHAFLGDLLVIGALEQHPNLGVGESEQSVDGAAPLGEWLLGGIQGSRPERDPTVEVVFKPAIAAANQAITQLDPDGRPDSLPEDLRLYDLRHTAASLMIRQGASVKAVQRQLGHATASITLDTYGHLFPDELDALAGHLEDARADALATLARTQRGPAVVPLREGAGQ